MISLRNVANVCLCLLSTSSCFASASPVRASDIIPECEHLSVGEGQKYNSYIGTHGKRCCMCRKGTFLAEECNLHDPNSTICKPCQYDEKNKSYVDFEPHMQRECKPDDSTCMAPKVYSPGSPSSPHQCNCPDGMDEADHGFRCVPKYVPNESSVELITTTTAKDNLTPTTTRAILEISTTLSSEDQNTMLPSSSIEEHVLASDLKEDQESPVSTTTDSNSTGTSGTTPDVTSMSRSFIALAVVLLIAAIVIGLKIKKHLYRDRKSSYSPGKVRLKDLHQKEKASDKDPPDKEESNSSACVDKTNMDDGQSGTATQEATPLIEEPVLSNSSRPISKKVQEHEDCEKSGLSEKRYVVFKKMAAVITKDDLCSVGRDLLPKEGREFEDIIEKNVGRQEKAMQVFLRAAELNTNLSLEHLLHTVKGLAYLEEIVKAGMKAPSVVVSED